MTNIHPAITDVAEIIAEFHSRPETHADRLLAAQIIGFLEKTRAEGLYREGTQCAPTGALFVLEVQTTDSAWSQRDGAGRWAESHEYTAADIAIRAAEMLTARGTGARVRDRLTGAIIWPAS